jgi:transcription initiation factor IIE alpha subunit
MSKYYVYHCDNCEVKFAVDQAIEDHSTVDCPFCLRDDYLADAGEAVDINEDQG